MTIEPLPRFAQSDYFPVPDRLKGVRYRQPSKRGWGPGWVKNVPWRDNPNFGKVHEYPANRFNPRVRDEAAELIVYLIQASNALGYDLRHAIDPSGGFGSFNYRAAKTASGREIASFHSWGLAIDQNTTGNPQGSVKTVTPPNVVHLWESCGFMWGGRWTGERDNQHFQYMGSPEDVANDLLTAQTMVPTRYPFTHEGQYLPSMVRVLQHRLEVHGFPLPDEGEWTPEYTTAVKAFQKAKGIRIDALVGAVTWGELNADPVDEHAEPEDDE
jgi:hypothetical protein